MALWAKANGDLVIDSAGNLVECADCPCEETGPCHPEKGIIGFDIAASNYTNLVTCFPDCAEYIENLATNISRLSECDLVFCGYDGTFPFVFKFTSDQFSTIQSWVEAGGRLCVVGEWSGVFTATETNNFMTSIGSAMQIGADVPEVGAGNKNGHAGTANLGAGFTTVKYAGAARVSGGTSVILSQNDEGDLPILSIEALGNGFVLLAGDSQLQYLSTAAGAENCDLWERWRTYADGNLI